MLERSNTVVNDNGEELDEGAILSVIVASGSRTTRKMRTRQAIQVTAVQYIVFFIETIFSKSCSAFSAYWGFCTALYRPGSILMHLI